MVRALFPFDDSIVPAIALRSAMFFPLDVIIDFTMSNDDAQSPGQQQQQQQQQQPGGEQRPGPETLCDVCGEVFPEPMLICQRCTSLLCASRYPIVPPQTRTVSWVIRDGEKCLTQHQSDSPSISCSERCATPGCSEGGEPQVQFMGNLTYQCTV